MPGAGMGRAVSGVTRRDSSSADMFGSPVTAPVTRLPTRMLVVHRRVRTGASAVPSTNGRKHLESVLGSPQTCILSSSSDPRAHLISHDSENGSNISEEHNEERRRLEMCTLSGGSGRKSRVSRGRPMRAYVNTSIQGRRCQWLPVVACPEGRSAQVSQALREAGHHRSIEHFRLPGHPTHEPTIHYCAS